jgi:DNA segregation ATPase FtsK/SpoIIIE-like protein
MPTYKSRRSGVDLRKMFQPVISADAQSALTELQGKEVLTGCTSFVQRKLQIGFNKAARLLEELEECGWISQPDDTGARHWLRKPSALPSHKSGAVDG